MRIYFLVILALVFGAACREPLPDNWPDDTGVETDTDTDTDADSDTDSDTDTDSDADTDTDTDTNIDTDNDGDGWTVEAGDCDDNNNTINPGAEEVCDTIDNDCDGDIDVDATDANTYYFDGDFDEHGDALIETSACEAPEQYVASFDDCDDTDPDTHPGADEECTDTKDLNCDGSIAYADVDGDGFAACEECDDSDAEINPSAAELCDGIDNNCDNDIDINPVTGADLTSTFYRDVDGDGYGDESLFEETCTPSLGYVELAGDCEDLEFGINPGIVELCTDTVDLNCDTFFGGVDNDTDGYAACADCDDGNSDINQDATEVCDDVDNDCDGDVDEPDADGAPTWYADSDSDAFGDSTTAQIACSPPVGYVANPDDCNDSIQLINPGADEVCDTVDNDCDGDIDDLDGNVIDQETWYADSDVDTFGDSAVTQDACNAPSGYVADSTDCDDTKVLINPDADEVCDTVDNDCDGGVDVGAINETTWYEDFDGDTFGDSTSTQDACNVPSGFVSNSDDCDDSTNTVLGPIDWYPDADDDGFGDENASATTACDAPLNTIDDNSDCDDTTGLVAPGAVEACGDHLDNNCDGDVDADDTDDVVVCDIALGCVDAGGNIRATFQGALTQRTKEPISGVSFIKIWAWDISTSVKNRADSYGGDGGYHDPLIPRSNWSLEAEQGADLSFINFDHAYFLDESVCKLVPGVNPQEGGREELIVDCHGAGCP